MNILYVIGCKNIHTVLLKLYQGFFSGGTRTLKHFVNLTEESKNSKKKFLSQTESTPKYFFFFGKKALNYIISFTRTYCTKSYVKILHNFMKKNIWILLAKF
jgi:hypothetical protein